MRSTITAFVALPFLLLAAAVPASAQPAQPPQPDLSSVLAKASAYVARYAKSLSAVVSEERYEQNLYRKGERTYSGITGDVHVTQTLVSDYLLVAVSGTSEWLPFRDVYSVNGVAIRDRSDRLLKLFVEAPADAYQQALRIRDESSRYNIGSGFRDTNVPTFALQFLSDPLRRGFTFTLKGRERRNDVDSVIVEFLETGSPTAIVGADGKDVPARGRYWVDPADGRILHTRLETRPSGWTNTIEVDFRFEPAMGLLVPGQMVEQRKGGTETLDGRAVYTNFRRFQVDTSFQIK
jgi:hypothetical protein